jgi:hypothetical protein
MTITITSADLLDFAADCERAAELVPEVLSDVAKDIGDAIEGRAVVTAQAKHHKTGTMASTIKARIVSVSAQAAVVDVSVGAVSAKGFPYPIVVDKGRGPIEMPKGRFMRFEGRDGKPVFLRRLPALAGSGFFTNAVTETEPEMQIVADQGAERLLNVLRR